jgi:hypothetical protein
LFADTRPFRRRITPPRRGHDVWTLRTRKTRPRRRGYSFGVPYPSGKDFADVGCSIETGQSVTTTAGKALRSIHLKPVLDLAKLKKRDSVCLKKNCVPKTCWAL